MSLSTRTEKTIIYGLTLLAFALRAYQLDAQSYWIDEAWTAYWANFSFGECPYVVDNIYEYGCENDGNDVCDQIINDSGKQYGKNIL